MTQRKYLKGAFVLVIGMGISGQSAAQFLLNRGAHVVGFDKAPDLILTNENVEQLRLQGMLLAFDESCIDPATFDLVVVSPGISPSHPLYHRALEQGIEVVGEIELACREISQKCLAVTGTNGKTTVTLLTAHVLQKSGINAIALGNVGIPLTSAVDEMKGNKVDVFVIELSSFQLETLSSRFIDAGVILNITPDHLDRYLSLEAYAAAKVGMEKNLKENGALFVEKQCLEDYRHLFKEEHYSTYGYTIDNTLHTDGNDVFCNGKKIFALPEKYRIQQVDTAHERPKKNGIQACHLQIGKLPNNILNSSQITNHKSDPHFLPASSRSHEVENIMAAYALCSTLSITPDEFLQALASFQKPSHRIEFIRTVNGVNYYDDSKGTNIDAVVRAVECLNGRIILIAGGVDKGFPYTPWIEAFTGKVKAICAIGQSKEKIKNDLGNFIPVITFSGIEEAVTHATALAGTGENVLLSPGCSSFDMFKDYAHRGHEFQRIINGFKEN